jgi:hypothetical protein
MVCSNALLWGDPMRQLHGYVASDFAWPLVSLLTGFSDPAIDAASKLLTLASLALTLAGAVGLIVRMRRGQPFTGPLLFWHVLAAAFYLLMPSAFVFGCLDRFLLACWPTSLIGLSVWFPRGRAAQGALLAAFSAASWLVALRWLVHMAHVFPFAERALPPWP